MKRITAFLTALLLLLPIAAGCASDTSAETETSADSDTSVQTEAAASAETERSQIKDGLPDDLDFEGRTIRIVHRDDGADLSFEVTSEETGDVVNDAIYNRQITVEERLNVKITDIPISSTIHHGSEVNDAIRKSVTSGSDDYDVSFNHMSQTTPLALEGMFIDLNTLDYLDFSRTWWAGHFMEQATINGRCYYAAGDISLVLIQSMYLMYCNKSLYADFFDDNLYDIVWDGAWTLDKMTELGTAVYTDINGNSAYDETDVYGFSINTNRLIDAMLVGADIPLSERASDGTPRLIVGEDERTFDFISAIGGILNNTALTWRVADTAEGEPAMLNKFSEGTLLFIPHTPMGAAQLRQMENDFGVLPMPKLSEEQEEYGSSAHNGFSAVTVLTTCKEPDKTAAVLEAMCAQSYRTVTPAYYETALKVKYSRDDETSQMLDMIRDSMKFDFGYIYNQSLSNPMSQFRTLVKSNTETAASTLASNMDTCNAKLEEMLEKYSVM